MPSSSLERLTPATTLEEIYQTLSPEPLETKTEHRAFYCEKINEIRGSYKIQRLKLGLRRVWDTKNYYKACLMDVTVQGGIQTLEAIRLDDFGIENAGF
jgi:hypothetical protein